MTEEVTIKTYLIKTSRDGELQIDIPDNWKVTYGPVSPGARNGELALRIYEAETKQRAIFTGVQSFRDLSIPVRRKVTSTEGFITWEQNEDGESENRSVKRTSEWNDDNG